MYFHSRADAGAQLAEQLFQAYRYENVAVVALSDGGVAVGEQIAERLHCVLTMLVSEGVNLPGESKYFGAVSQEGTFTHSSDLTSSEVGGYTAEFHGYFEEKKREAFQKINRLVGEGGTIDHDMLRDHTIILVDDGLSSTISLDVAFDFLKPIRVQRLVIATPIASVDIVDKVHMVADELHILDVKQNYMGTDHYYELNDLPSHEETVAKINQIILNWR